MVVDDQHDAVALVEDGIADARRQTVVPEAAVAHDRNGALAGLDIERRGGGRPKTITHRRRADVEWRHDREQVAADIRRDMMRSHLAFGTAGAEARWPGWHGLGQAAHMLLVEGGRRIGSPHLRCQDVRDPLPRERADGLRHHGGSVFAGHREGILAREHRRNRGLA
jgi:hypothetical protein